MPAGPTTTVVDVVDIAAGATVVGSVAVVVGPMAEPVEQAETNSAIATPRVDRRFLWRNWKRVGLIGVALRSEWQRIDSDQHEPSQSGE